VELEILKSNDLDRTVAYYLVCIFLCILPFYTVLRVGTYPLALIVLGAAFGLILLGFVNGRKIRIPKTFFISALVACVAIVMGNIYYKEPSMIDLRDFIPIICVFMVFTILNVTKGRSLFSLIRVMVNSALVATMLIVLEYLGIFDFDFVNFHTNKNGVTRFLGIGKTPNPNNFSIYIFFNLLFSIYLFKNDNLKKSFGRGFKLAVRVICFSSVLLFLQSKALIFGAASFLILYLLLTSARKGPKDIAKIGILGLLILAFIYLGFEELLPERLHTFNLHHRMPRWVAALKIAEDNLLTGVGFNNIKSMSLDRISQEDVVREMNTHNLYLEFLSATGLFGVLALIALIVNVGILVYYLKKRKNRMFFHALMGVTCYFLCNLTHVMLFSYYFWVFLGFLEVEVVRPYERSRQDLRSHVISQPIVV
jgi:O-antigen ligase